MAAPAFSIAQSGNVYTTFSGPFGGGVSNSATVRWTRNGNAVTVTVGGFTGGGTYAGGAVAIVSNTALPACARPLSKISQYLQLYMSVTGATWTLKRHNCQIDTNGIITYYYGDGGLITANSDNFTMDATTFSYSVNP